MKCEGDKGPTTKGGREGRSTIEAQQIRACGRLGSCVCVRMGFAIVSARVRSIGHEKRAQKSEHWVELHGVGSWGACSCGAAWLDTFYRV